MYYSFCVSSGPVMVMICGKLGDCMTDKTLGDRLTQVVVLELGSSYVRVQGMMKDACYPRTASLISQM